MAVKKIKTVGVVGAGVMGRGIAQVFALYNFPVVLYDKSKEALDNAVERIRERTAPEFYDCIVCNIKTTHEIQDLKDRDLVIEAVFEELEVKKAVFAELSAVCREDAVLATNTSAISITELAKTVSAPERFIGMHFMNPPKVMKLVEIVRGLRTADETVKAVIEVAGDIEKVIAVVNDSPGFITNRLLFALLGEAMRLLEQGAAKKEDIDTVMKYGMGHPMGPIELADFIGLDVCMEIMLYLYKELRDERYRPTRQLEELVRAGKLGRKTREGFYTYAQR